MTQPGDRPEGARRVFHVTGPPGTGKTTAIARYARDATIARGAQSVVIASMTRAAATEIAGRDLLIPKDHVGTLHALCLRALGRPELAHKHVSAWNQAHPGYALSGGSQSIDDAGDSPAHATSGDKLMGRFELLRHQLMPEALWPESIRAFGGAWRQWMKDMEVIDFTGLLELATEIVPVAPGDPQVLLGDEVQDWSKLETRLFRDRWGQHAETVVMVGDTDQSIFEWRGANPRIFMDDPVAPENCRLLAQSYRVPRAVHALAQRIIRQIPDRDDARYQPRDADGEVVQSSATWKTPERLLPLLEEAASGGPAVMILATCSYLLGPTLALLRRRAIPFHNPYRLKQGAWNPLRGRERDIRHAADRVMAFLRPAKAAWGDAARPWSAEDILAWIEPLRAAGMLVRGAKSALDANFEVGRDFHALFEGGAESLAVRSAQALDLDWYRANLLPTAARTMAFALDVAQQRGPQSLFEKPRVTIGTCHSVKGGESPIVVLFPDISLQAARASYEQDGIDAQHRLAYVAVTRARESVVLCRPSSSLHMRIPV